MTQAVITLGEYEDRILTIVKGKYGFKNKSDAVNFVINQFDDMILESKLRPEYVEKLKKIQKGTYNSYSSMEDFRKKIERS
jgi:endonuclease IV